MRFNPIFGQREAAEKFLAWPVVDLPTPDVPLFKDYDLAWDYYKQNLEERREIIRRILIVTSAPSAVASVVAFAVRLKILDDLRPILGVTPTQILPLTVCAIWVIYIYSLLQLISLASEERVSQDYLNFINRLRRYLGEEVPKIQIRFFFKYRKFEDELDALLSDKNAAVDASPARSSLKKILCHLVDFLKFFRKPRFWRASGVMFLMAVLFSVSTGLTWLWVSPGYICKWCIFLTMPMAFLFHVVWFRRVAGDRK
ncbi:hypothetical protein [Rhodopseudomonas sp. BR0M22]|uniref:hypothetical protein n=1 Tax=Rhodopseudomonas sp. BR0M22 TaxID=2269369 RepID=UPI0013E03A1B|nr:hypothetical protein [Rhodopseudomonas sp. BR0M22]